MWPSSSLPFPRLVGACMDHFFYLLLTWASFSAPGLMALPVILLSFLLLVGLTLWSWVPATYAGLSPGSLLPPRAGQPPPAEASALPPASCNPCCVSECREWWGQQGARVESGGPWRNFTHQTYPEAETWRNPAQAAGDRDRQRE